MSGVDPLAASVAGSIDAAALEAMIDAELAQLAADANALGALLVEGVVVNARVLPSNGLTDLLEIAGRRVAASLPPTVRPGDVLQVKVTGFEGGRILLQIVATGANAAIEPGPPNVPPAPDAAPAASGPANAVPPGSAAGSPPAVPAGSAQATPAGVPATDELPPLAVAPTRPGITAGFTSAVSRANVAQPPSSANAAASANPSPSSPAAPRGAIIRAAEPSSIEARVAASRATAAQSAPPAAVDEPAPAAVRTGQPFVAPPQIGAKAVIPSAPPAPRVTGLAVYTQPVALLRALKLPVTPSNVASAALALQRPGHVPAALAALEAALPAASENPQIATLRTLLAFIGRIDPRSPALAAQIAAYVEHVVDGAEPKLATLLAATREAERVGSGAQEPAGDARGDVASRAPAEEAPAPPPALPAAVVAERSAALTGDLKQTLLAVAGDAATPASLAPSLAGALTALTAVQVHAAQSLAAHPEGLAFTIPLATQHGPAHAQITVQRDAPQHRGVPLDGENFRVAFVLDTAHYGTVAIDLVTVGREVTVDVRTDSAPAMRAFRDALGTLTARLESLRYRVASAGARVGATSTVTGDVPPAPAADPSATVDRSA
jgi:hypothetical protein